MIIAKRQKIFMVVFLLAIVISLLYVAARTYITPGLSFGINEDKFVKYLNEGNYAAARTFWDETLAKHSADSEIINDRLDGHLQTHLQYMDIYCADKNFSVAGFHARYGDIGALGPYVESYLMISAARTVTRYANLNLSYNHARAVVEMLCNIAEDPSSGSAMIKALDAYKSIIAEYKKAEEHMQMQNYLGAVEILSIICNNIDKDIYLHYIAS